MTTETCTDKKHLVEWLRGIALERRSGLLQVRSGSEVWRFHCVLGEIRAAVATPSTLLEEGRAEPAAFTRKVLTSLVASHLTQSSFSETQQTPSPQALMMHVQISALLPEFARTAMNPELIRQQLTRAGGALISVAVSDWKSDCKLLTSDEAYLLSRLESPLRINELLSLSPFDETQTLRHLGTLYLLGLIHVRDASPHSASPAPSEIPKSAFTAAAPRVIPSVPSTSAIDEHDLLTLQREIEERLYLIARGTFYDLLELPRGASDEEIKTAYYKLAKRFHPDRYQATVPKAIHEQLVTLFGHFSEAYQTLSDPARRAEYDGRTTSAASKAEAKPSVTSATTPGKDRAEESYLEGRRCFERGDYEKSLPYLRGAVKLKPDVVKYRSFLARSLSKIPHHRKEAEEQFLQLIERDPHNAVHCVALASLYIDVNLPTRARKMFERALEIDPHNAQALKALGRTPSTSKDQSSLGTQFKKLFSKKSDDSKRD